MEDLTVMVILEYILTMVDIFYLRQNHDVHYMIKSEI